MEPKFQTSFIPKKAVSEPAKRSSRGRVDLLFLVALILFLASLASGVGVFLYSKIVDARIESKSTQLERARSAFDPELIEEISRLSRRLTVVDSLLSKHTSIVAVLNALEQSSLKSIRFENFNYSMVGDKINIEMRGIAGNFGSIALQSDKFGQSRYIKDPIFSNLNLNERGDVTFSFSATVDPQLVLYKTNLTRQ